MKTFLNLATLRRGGGMTHINAFLPELINLLPVAPTIFVPDELQAWAKVHTDHVVTHTVPEGSIKLAFTQQMTARRHARGADVVLSVMNTGPIMLPVTQIIWACNVTHFTPGKKLTARIQNWTVLKAMDRCDICIFPSDSARQMATEAGFRNDSKVFYHPMRARSGHWQKSNNTGTLKIFVPASNNAHKNLAIVPQVSRVLSDRGIDHEFNLTIDRSLAAEELQAQPHLRFIGRYQPEQLVALISEHDVAFIPSLLESYSYSLAELEELGMPLAVSNIPVHTEISRNARLFDPKSSVDAADAIALAIGQKQTGLPSTPFISEPNEYATKVFALMQELLAKKQTRQ